MGGTSEHTAAHCPSCGRPLTHLDADGMLSCDCGLRAYSGYVSEYEYLTSRRQWLWERIAEQSGAPDPQTARAYGVWSAGAETPAQQPRRSSTSTQTLLVSLGAGLLIVAALVFVAVAWPLLGVIGQIVVLVAATILATVTAIFLRNRVPRTAEALAVVAFTLGLIVAGAATDLGALPRSWADAGMYPVIVSLIAVAFGIGLGHRFAMVTWVWLGWLSTPVLLASGLTSTIPWADAGQAALTAGVLSYLALGAGLLYGSRMIDRLPVRVSAAVSALIAAAFTLRLLDFSPPTGANVAIAAALLLLLLAHEATGNAATAWVGWPLFGSWLALLAMHVPDSSWLTAAMAAAGVALLFLIARWGVGLAAVSAAALWTTWLIGSWESDQWLFFGIVGTGLLAFSLRSGAAPLAWFGAVALQTAFLLQVDSVPFFEVPTLVFAGLLLLAGLVQKRADERHSLVIYAPALTVALLPTSVLLWDDVWSQASLIRFGVVMVVGIGCLLVGVRAHLLGLVIPATIAVSITATAQIWATLDTLPRWLALALAGALLIVIGARIEWVRGKGQQTSHWLHTLR